MPMFVRYVLRVHITGHHISSSHGSISTVGKHGEFFRGEEISITKETLYDYTTTTQG